MTKTVEFKFDIGDEVYCSKEHGIFRERVKSLSYKDGHKSYSFMVNSGEHEEKRINKSIKDLIQSMTDEFIDTIYFNSSDNVKEILGSCRFRVVKDG